MSIEDFEENRKNMSNHAEQLCCSNEQSAIAHSIIVIPGKILEISSINSSLSS